ncbi:MAG: hypothetical protein HY077_12735 [Elusimicrobia bacterium]|nr:hypothetical protein [Elusimicrobiota bacterium]
MKQCQAVTLASSYTHAHQCLKTAGLKRSGKRILCAHHYPKVLLSTDHKTL